MGAHLEVPDFRFMYTSLTRGDGPALAGFSERGYRIGSRVARQPLTHGLQACCSTVRAQRSAMSQHRREGDATLVIGRGQGTGSVQHCYKRDATVSRAKV